MKWVAAAIGVFFGLIVLVLGGFIWLNHRAQSAADTQHAAIAAAVKPVEDALARGAAPDDALLDALAADPMTRLALYELLEEKQSLARFPKAYLTRAALGESALVVWLAHPNELDGTPDKIELAKEVVVGSEAYCVYRFRTSPPHWASSSGWMSGVTGPYPVGGTADPPPREGGAFSTLEPFATFTPEQHVERARSEMGGIGVVKTER